MTNKRGIGKRILQRRASRDAHLSDDKTVAKMGHPAVWVEKQIPPQKRGGMTDKIQRQMQKTLLQKIFTLLRRGW